MIKNQVVLVFTSIAEGQIAWFDQQMTDGGPRYTEFHSGQLIVEPWNAVSSVFMMLPALYWLIRWWPQLKLQFFLLYSLTLVFLGGLGSTLFHAFRVSSFFLYLDFVPPAVLTLSLSVFFLLKILPGWRYVALVLLPVIALRVILFQHLPQHLSINLSYAFSGMIIIVPLLIYLIKTRFLFGGDVLLTILLFGFALFFRQTDIHSIDFLPQGTHFLWHIFSAAGAWYLLRYLGKISLKPAIRA